MWRCNILAKGEGLNEDLLELYFSELELVDEGFLFLIKAMEDSPTFKSIAVRLAYGILNERKVNRTITVETQSRVYEKIFKEMDIDKKTWEIKVSYDKSKIN